MSEAIIGLVVVAFVGLCILAGHAQQTHEHAIFARCDAHGGVWRIARDGSDVIGATCNDLTHVR